MVEDVPAGLPVGPNLNERIVVDGYFLKLLRYQAGDSDRAAPLLVGRLRWPSAGGPAGRRPRRGEERPWNLLVVVVVAALAVYVAVRLAFQVRRVMVPSSRRRGQFAPDRPAEEIAPAALSDWLASVPDEDVRTGGHPDSDFVVAGARAGRVATRTRGRTRPECGTGRSTTW